MISNFLTSRPSPFHSLIIKTLRAIRFTVFVAINAHSLTLRYRLVETAVIYLASYII